MKREYKTFGNPYLPLWEHLPDGEPRVFEDPDNPGKYRAYIIGSHDVRMDSYCGPDIRAWSAPVEDLTMWRDEGPIFTYESDGLWDVMYAPDLVEVKRKDGTKDYYLYPHSRGPHREAMVAKGSRPDGPFTPINVTEDGKRTVEGSIMGFDPSVFVEYITDENDPDFEIGFRAYGFWGFQRIHAAQLDQNTMYSLRPGTEIITCFIPSSSRYGEIRDPEGTTYPHVYADEDLKTFNFFEAASIRKVGNKFVWVYSGYSGPDYGLSSTNSALRYAFGDTPLGPWRGGGVLVDSRAVVLNQNGTALDTGYAGHNTHGSIQFINGQWYVFYHRAPRGFSSARQPMVAPVNIQWDEKPVSEGGRVSIRAWDPYAEGNIWTAAKAGDNEYKGAEVTSEGFYIYGLDPYRYYSAGIACYLSENRVQGDAWDIWDDHAPITDVADGNIIGYKYFNFMDAGKDVKDSTVLNLFITPKTPQPFKINIWLDGPWDNDAWKGKKIGEINVPAGSAQVNARYTADVSEYISGLDKKHAIYLVAESVRMGPYARRGSLFDLMGLGFSSKNNEIVRPVAPTVSVVVNNIKMDLSETPVRSTYANGIVGYDIYEKTVTLADGCTEIPKVEAFASDAGVKIAVTQPDSVKGTAVIKFDYNGEVKTYNILFK